MLWRSVLRVVVMILLWLLGDGLLRGAAPVLASEHFCLPPQAEAYLSSLLSTQGAPTISETAIGGERVSLHLLNPPLTVLLRHPEPSLSGSMSQNFLIEGVNAEAFTREQAAAFERVVRFFQVHDKGATPWISCRPSTDVLYTAPPPQSASAMREGQPQAVYPFIICFAGLFLTGVSLVLAWPLWQPLFSRTSWVFWLLLFFFSFAVRYFLAPWVPLSSQGVAYHRLISQGEGYELYYSFARTLSYFCHGVHPILAAQWLNLVISALSVLSLYAATLLLTSGPWLAWVAAVLGALWPYSLIYSTSLRAMPLVVFYATLAVAFFAIAVERPTRRNLWAACLWLCAFALCRKEIPVVIAMMGMVAMLGRGLSWRQVWVWGVPVLIGMGLILEGIGLDEIIRLSLLSLGKLLAVVSFGGCVYLVLAYFWKKRARPIFSLSRLSYLSWVCALYILIMVSHDVDNLVLPFARYLLAPEFLIILVFCVSFDSRRRGVKNGMAWLTGAWIVLFFIIGVCKWGQSDVDREEFRFLFDEWLPLQQNGDALVSINSAQDLGLPLDKNPGQKLEAIIKKAPNAEKVSILSIREFSALSSPRAFKNTYLFVGVDSYSMIHGGQELEPVKQIKEKRAWKLIRRKWVDGNLFDFNPIDSRGNISMRLFAFNPSMLPAPTPIALEIWRLDE